MQQKPQQIPIDLKNATPRLCECGGKYFQPLVTLLTIPALMSPTGQELIVQQQAYSCMECKAILK